MSLAKVNELLQHAAKNHYGVAAVNVINVETVRYIIEAAEMERVPVIVQFYPGHPALDKAFGWGINWKPGRK